MKALVAGATGETGRRIIQELTKRQIPVKALVRSLERGREILPESVELVVGDVLQPETLVNALNDCNLLLCATGAKPSFNPTEPYLVDYQGTKNLVDASVAQGIQHFVIKKIGSKTPPL